MPELPEVESVRRTLVQAEITGRTITAAHIGWAKTVKAPSATEIAAALTGRTIGQVQRRGKYLVFPLSGSAPATFVIHLGMTGWLWLDQQSKAPHPMIRHTFPLDDGRELRFEDSRKFGKMWLVNDTSEALPKLSPEPLGPDFTTEWLVGSLAGRKAPVKALLLDQSIAAGLGNLYTDECLFLARIHPERPASELSVDEVVRLRQGIIEALTAAFGVYDRAREQYWPDQPDALAAWTHPRERGAECPLCGTPMLTTRVRGRGTCFCPTCQV
jgi:formamidopyrimidine-DNA glycosylase